jgi:hypothetical protein
MVVLNLKKFKTKKCKKNFSHNIKNCPYYHKENDHRRVTQLADSNLKFSDEHNYKNQPHRAIAGKYKAKIKVLP